MKVIPKRDLIMLLESEIGLMIGFDYINSIFEAYGDDYFRDYGSNIWEEVQHNELREARIKMILRGE